MHSLISVLFKYDKISFKEYYENYIFAKIV